MEDEKNIPATALLPDEGIFRQTARALARYYAKSPPILFWIPAAAMPFLIIQREFALESWASIASSVTGVQDLLYVVLKSKIIFMMSEMAVFAVSLLIYSTVACAMTYTRVSWRRVCRRIFCTRSPGLCRIFLAYNNWADLLRIILNYFMVPGFPIPVILIMDGVDVLRMLGAIIQFLDIGDRREKRRAPLIRALSKLVAGRPLAAVFLLGVNFISAEITSRLHIIFDLHRRFPSCRTASKAAVLFVLLSFISLFQMVAHVVFVILCESDTRHEAATSTSSPSPSPDETRHDDAGRPPRHSNSPCCTTTRHVSAAPHPPRHKVDDT